MTKDDFLTAVKLITGIEIKLGNEYYIGNKIGNKIGVIRPVEFMVDGRILYEYYTKEDFFGIRSKIIKRTASCSYYQLMECINDIREIIPEKIHHKWMIHP